MKRKLLTAIVLSYTLLIVMIVSIGLSFQQAGQPSATETEDIISTTDNELDEYLLEPSDTAFVSTETGSDATESLVSPSLEPALTQTVTATSEDPTQIQQTSTPSAPTPTSAGYPINGEGTPTNTLTPQSYPVNDPLNSTISPTITLAPTDTSILQTGWQGEWWVFWEQTDGHYLPGLMNLDINGSEFIATASIGEEQFSFQGIINQNQNIAVGSWSDSQNSGNIYWRIYDSGQFTGNSDRQYGFCGSRAENDMPDPCFLMPSDK